MAKRVFKDLESAPKEFTEDLSRKIALFEEFKKSKGWRRIARLVHCKVLMELSSQRLVFVSVNTELSGRFVEIVNLGLLNSDQVKRTLFNVLNHILKIRKKYLKDPKTENEVEPEVQNASNSALEALG